MEIRKIFLCAAVTVLLALGVWKFGVQDVSVAVTQKTDGVCQMTGKEAVVRQSWMAEHKKINRVDFYYDPGVSSPDIGENFWLRIFADGAAEVVLAEVDGSVETEGCISFRFADVALTLGERYFFQLTGSGQELDLALYQNSDYAGLTLNGADMDAAVKMDIYGPRMSQPASLFLILFVFGSLSMMYMLLFGKRFEETLCLAVATVGLVLYGFGLFNLLNTGFWVVMGLAVCSWLAACLAYVRGRPVLKELQTPGAVFFLLLFCFLVIYNRSSWAFRAEWDEYSYWGVAVKDLFYYDRLAVHPGSTIHLDRYVPMMPLLQYFAMRTRGVVSDGYMYLIYQLAAFSFLLPLFAEKEKKDWRNGVKIAVLMMLFPLIQFTSFYYSIYIDAFLGIAAGYILCAYFKEKNSGFQWFSMAMGTAMLVLVKEMGCILLVCIAMVIGADILRDHLQKESGKGRICRLLGNRQLWKLAAVCLWGMVCFGSYQLYRGANHGAQETAAAVLQAKSLLAVQKTPAALAAGLMASGSMFSEYVRLLSLDKLMLLVAGQGTDWQYESLKNWVTHMASEKAYFGLTYIQFFVGINLLALFWKLVAKGKNYLHVTLTLSAGAFLYSVILEFMYLTLFSVYEAVHLSSIIRYLGSYVLMAAYLMLFLFLKESVQLKKERGNLALLVLVLLVVWQAPVQHFVTKWCFDEHFVVQLKENYVYTQAAFRSFASEEEAVYHVNRDNDRGGMNHRVFLDAMIPVASQWDQGNIHTAEYNTAATGKKVEVSAWAATLRQGYDYVYLDVIDDDFINSYRELFGEEEIMEGGIYRVEDAADSVRLVRIAKAVH